MVLASGDTKHEMGETQGEGRKGTLQQYSILLKDTWVMMDSLGHLHLEDVLSWLMKRVERLSQMQEGQDPTSRKRYRYNKWHDVTWGRQTLEDTGLNG